MGIDLSLPSIIIYALMVGIPLIAQSKIMSNYSKYKRVENKKRISGQEVARKILDKNGLSNVHVVEVAGDLTDHYDPSRKVVRLSTDIFHGETIAAASVAAHECGHAIQDKVGYKPMRVRSLLVLPVNLTSYLSWTIIVAGIFAQYFKLFALGLGLFSITLVFQLVTLPVEFNASSRAKKELNNLGLVDNDEASGVSKMLGAAAMTYVASVLTNVLQILRFVLMFNNNKR